MNPYSNIYKNIPFKNTLVYPYSKSIKYIRAIKKTIKITKNL